MTAPGLSCSLWDLVPWPGVEPGPSALGEWSLSHWTTREVLRFQFADILGKIQLWRECWPHRGSTADLFRVMERYYSFAVVVITCLCLVAQSCLTLCNPLDCSPPGSSVHGDSPGKNIGVDCHALLQGILPSQGSNPGIPHCRCILYHLSHQGSPWILQWVAYPFSRETSWPRHRSGVPCIAGRFFTSWATREVLKDGVFLSEGQLILVLICFVCMCVCGGGGISKWARRVLSLI